MQFRDTIIETAQEPLDKAHQLLTVQIKANPTAHLDSLIIAQGALRDAKQIYQKGKIGGYQDPKLIELTHFFSELEPQLVVYAKSLLIEVVEKTERLRLQIEEAKNQPYSARGNNTSQMVDYLGDKYNQEVKACCLNKLSQIDKLLHSNRSEHRQLIVLIRSINTELGKVIREQDYGKQLKRRINQL
ncbi:hypothetical protein GCM10009114_14760 [Aliiglaciecola litoralis]|uniref:Restart primosome assembly protein PriC n=2 Tax=Aliiglaciecola litoralis TaxID=582857 RepID=A0ABN1LH50_9ALTE